ncbi:hypothetical protein FRC02_008860 [Tulasnella sp. 418]|nr:hypothetical protein FRC02_008860 [Tulasnella sp. 418]
MPELSVAKTTNSAFSPIYRPVVLIVGGTSGIGRGVAERFAHYTQGNAHILICGRNRVAAEEIIASFPKHPESLYEFVECDASLMKNVVQVSSVLKSKLTTLNYLVMSQGIFTFQGRTETAEGIDHKLALHFYSRWKFFDELSPLLLKAKELGQEARVMTVMATGDGGKIDLNDLGLKKNYSMWNSGKAAPTYNDLLVEEYAMKYPQLSFIHAHPGFVATPLAGHAHWLFKATLPLLTAFAVSAETSAEYLLYSLIRPDFAKGGFHVERHGDLVPESHLYISDEAREKVFAHYKELTNV